MSDSRGGHYLARNDVRELCEIWDEIESIPEYQRSNSEKHFVRWIRAFAERKLQSTERRQKYRETHGYTESN